MAQQTKAGILFNGITATAFASVQLPLLPCVMVLFISITGTVTLEIQVKDGIGDFITLKTITDDAVVRLAVPASEIGVNVTSVSGSVTVTYRSLVVENVPNEVIDVFQGGEVEPQTIITLQDQVNPEVWKKVFQGFLTTTIATLYTVPAATQSKLTYIMATNTTGTDRTFELYHDGATAGFNILPASTVVAGGYAEFTGDGPLMEAGDTLQGKASAATAITLTVYAKEQGT